MTSRELNRDTGGAKKAALNGRGKPAHVLLPYEDFLSLAREHHDIGELLALDDEAELAAPRFAELARPADLS